MPAFSEKMQQPSPGVINPKPKMRGCLKDSPFFEEYNIVDWVSWQREVPTFSTGVFQASK